VVLEVNVRESLRQDAAGPGCERHKGDPHNLCPECWKLEPDVKPSLYSFRFLVAWVVGCWLGMVPLALLLLIPGARG